MGRLKRALRELKSYLEEINRLLPKDMRLNILVYGEDNISCLVLECNGITSQLGICVGPRQIWKIREQLLALTLVLEKLREKGVLIGAGDRGAPQKVWRRHLGGTEA